MARVRSVHVYGLPAVVKELCEARLGGRAVHLLEDEASFRLALGEMEVLLALRPPRGFWDEAARLRLVQTVGAGVDAVLPAPDLPESVQLANARGVHAGQMSEFALAMMLALSKRIPQALEQQRARRWQMYGPHPLAGRTCGILGLGAIGEAVAERARQFGMRVIATQRNPKPSPVADEVLPPGGTERVVREADHLVVLLPLTPETRGLLGAKLLAKLKPEAVLVDMARGGIVDEAALAEMLHEGRLRGAALDVFEEEPLPEESPLWDAPNLIVTPHIAGLAPDYMERVLEILAENLERLEAGEPLRNAVDRTRGY